MRLLLATFCLVLLLFSTIASAKIVFSLRDVSIHEDVNGVYVMDDNGNNITLLTKNTFTTSRWSPDGRQIVFSGPSKEKTGRYIFLIDPNGNNIKQLTGLHEVSIDLYPSLFPNGKSLLFFRNNKGPRNKGLRVMDLESREIRIIGDFPLIYPDLSPNGQYIVYTKFVSSILKEVSNIWIMNADGSDQNQLLPPAPRVVGLILNRLIIDRRHPRWNRYGNRIVYMERRYKATKFGPGIVAVSQGYHYFIYHLDSGELRELDGIPKELEADSIDWMDNDESLVFSACQRTLFGWDDNIYPPYRFYKYHITTGEISDLADHRGEPISVDWIRDDAHDPVYAVSRVGKLTMKWGELKRK